MAYVPGRSNSPNPPPWLVAQRLERVAELKNKHNLTQRAIAARLGMSQPAVARYMKLAAERGMLKS